jgi:hypothetical protein
MAAPASGLAMYPVSVFQNDRHEDGGADGV